MEVRCHVASVPLVLALLTAAVLQAVLIARMPTISADGIIFTFLARDMAVKPIAAIRAHDQHPGYPAAMLAATRAAQWLGFREEPDCWMIGGRAVSFACGLLSVWVVWLFARSLYDTRVANVAAFVFAILPLARVSAADAQSDMAHALVYLTAAWLACSAIAGGRLLLLAGAGAASALAYWIRPEGLEVFLVALLFVALRALRSEMSWKRSCASAATLVGVTVLVAAPYPILAGKITSKQLPFVKSQTAPTYVEQIAQVKPPEPSAGQPTETAKRAGNVSPDVGAPAPNAANVGAAPAPSPVEPQRRYTVGLILRLGCLAIVALAVSLCQGFRYVFVPFYLLGQREMVRLRTNGWVVALLWTLASLHLFVLVWVYFVSGYIAARHVLPLLPLAMPFTALGILYVADRLSGVTGLSFAKTEAATLAVCAAVVLPFCARAHNREFLPVIAATRWVQAHAAPGSGIVCNSPYVGYYGRLPTTILGPEALTLDAALARGAAGVRYDYAVLHVGAHDYRPDWLEQIQKRYRQVGLYPDPTSHQRPRTVLVFESIESHARRPADRASPDRS
jgi:hypothetical protein